MMNSKYNENNGTILGNVVLSKVLYTLVKNWPKMVFIKELKMTLVGFKLNLMNFLSHCFMLSQC